jgi:hypothetical protein
MRLRSNFSLRELIGIFFVREETGPPGMKLLSAAMLEALRLTLLIYWLYNKPAILTELGLLIIDEFFALGLCFLVILG